MVHNAMSFNSISTEYTSMFTFFFGLLSREYCIDCAAYL